MDRDGAFGKGRPQGAPPQAGQGAATDRPLNCPQDICPAGDFAFCTDAGEKSALHFRRRHGKMSVE